MTTSYYADRVNLLQVQQLHPDWTQPQVAAALGRSLGWVKKWQRRIRFARARGEPLSGVVQGHSRARKHPPLATPPLVEERILAIRDAPLRSAGAARRAPKPSSPTCPATPRCRRPRSRFRVRVGPSIAS